VDRRHHAPDVRRDLRSVIAGEERYLRQTFPDYDDYAAGAAFFPAPYTLRQPAERLLLRALLEAPEYQASLGCAVVLAVLVAKLMLPVDVVVCRYSQ